jgi:hypothetical protein
MNCTEEQAAWLAGFLDGEGSISIDKRAGADSARYAPRVKAANTRREVLEEIRELLGGGFVTKTRRKPTDPRKDIFQFVAANRKGLDIIRRVRPYMRVKNAQADLFLRYYDVAVLSVGKHRGSEIRRLQDTLYEEMKELNRKGK